MILPVSKLSSLPRQGQYFSLPARTSDGLIQLVFYAEVPSNTADMLCHTRWRSNNRLILKGDRQIKIQDLRQWRCPVSSSHPRCYLQNNTSVHTGLILGHARLYFLLLMLDKNWFLKRILKYRKHCQNGESKIDANLVLGGPEPHQTKDFIPQKIPPSIQLVKPTPRLLPLRKHKVSNQL